MRLRYAVEMKKSSTKFFAGALCCVFLTACPADDSGTPPLGLADDCQPHLAGRDCMLPYPSDFFRVADPSLPSGHKIQMGRHAVLLTKDGYSADPTDWRASDGFSTAPPILTVLGSAVDISDCTKIFDDLQTSISDASPTLIIEADSGTRVPHFVDLDARASDPLRQALILRPAYRLKNQTRYIVALRRLRDPDGQVIAAPEGFRRLRDDDTGGEAVLQTLSQRYNSEVFAPLAAQGIARAELQLAWDFTTGSAEWPMRDMLDARVLILHHLQNNLPELVSLNFIEGENPEIWRRIQGVLRVPLLMEHDGPGAEIHRDAQGAIAFNGTMDVPFTATIPTSLQDVYDPGQAVEYGHGVFGSQSKLVEYGTRSAINSIQGVGFAIDWVGMSEADVGITVSDIGDQVWRTMRFSDRVVQAMVNWISLDAAIRQVFVDQEVFHRPSDPQALGVVEDPHNPGSTNAGALLYDPSKVRFFGGSQGGILGGILSALDPNLQRSVLHVAAAGWTQFMTRSEPFKPFLFLMDLSVEDPLEEQKLIAALAMYFDRVDPSTYAPYLLDQELPWGPPGQAATRQVLLQIVTADSHVANFGSYYYARSLGLPLLVPSVRAPSLIPEANAPYNGSALAILDMLQDESFYLSCQPPEGPNPGHTCLRETWQAQQQIDAFLRRGEVINPCGNQGCFIPGW